TEWGEDPDWHAIRYGYTAAVDYPYVYVGELKEGQGSEWDPYDDIYRHVVVWDSLFIYRYDVRDLSAEPAVYVTQGSPMIEGFVMNTMAAGGGVLLITKETDYDMAVLVLGDTDSGLDSVGWIWPMSATRVECVVGDTFYYHAPYSVYVLQWDGASGFDTLGYYCDTEDSCRIIGGIVAEGNKIYTAGTDYRLNIFEIYPSGIESDRGDELAKESEGLLVMNDVIELKDVSVNMGLYDISGRMLFEVPGGNKRIYIGNYPSGIYFLRSIDGRFSKKVVIVH
ncbi:T9SS type A sorting domain-containing protein, partial [bacterium]|nr:T9SS type A sorting domain-containing protein [bacterium]